MKALSLPGCGLAIEIIQYLLPYRSFSLHDPRTDVTGLLAYGISIRLRSDLPLSPCFFPESVISSGTAIRVCFMRRESRRLLSAIYTMP